MPLPFGLPNIEIPPPPGPPEHAGTGAPPGPTTNMPIDMSITYNGPVGSDPAEVQRQNAIAQDKAIARVGPIAPDR